MKVCQKDWEFIYGVIIFSFKRKENLFMILGDCPENKNIVNEMVWFIAIH